MIEATPEAPGPALLMVVSGPAGVGKSTVCDRLIETHPEAIGRAVTATTRMPREGEQEGVDYYFVSEIDFALKREQGAFYEWAKVHTQFYGTPRAEVDRLLGLGRDVVLVIDVQGAASLRQLAQSDVTLRDRLVTVFLHPGDLDELESRLNGRGTEDPEELARRMQTARAEVTRWTEYDYCLVSRDRGYDFERLNAIYLAEKMRLRGRVGALTMPPVNPA